MLAGNKGRESQFKTQNAITATAVSVEVSMKCCRIVNQEEINKVFQHAAVGDGLQRPQVWCCVPRYAEQSCRMKDSAPLVRAAAGSRYRRSMLVQSHKTVAELVRNHHFDAGQKKVPRQHQFQGVKAAQERVAKQEGGDLAHPGQRQEHPDGVDRQMAAGTRPWKPASWSSPIGTNWTSRSSASCVTPG